MTTKSSVDKRWTSLTRVLWILTIYYIALMSQVEVMLWSPCQLFPSKAGIEKTGPQSMNMSTAHCFLRIRSLSTPL